jgi:SAM-dependent methyltransferase
LSLDENSFVIEVASNDGHLLENFVSRNIPCLGIEPANNTAEAARGLGIRVVEEFFSESLAEELAHDQLLADLVIGNNVYAHVPEINNFTSGLKKVLKPGGTITLEFPHVQELLEHTQFDTIYHEHFSYLSLFTVSKIFAEHGLRVWHADRLVTHGGSLRVYGCHTEDSRESTPELDEILREETARGLQTIETYLGFQQRADRIKDDLVLYLMDRKRDGQAVVAYGAAAKGNTLLNFAGIRGDLLSAVYDAAPSKQGKFLPGSHIPVRHPQELYESSADHILILPWNLSDEIRSQITIGTPRSMHFLTAIPRLIVS